MEKDGAVGAGNRFFKNAPPARLLGGHLEDTHEIGSEMYLQSRLLSSSHESTCKEFISFGREEKYGRKT
jgi:hypothetical protein